MEGQLQNSSNQASASGTPLDKYDEIIYIDFPKKYKRDWSQSIDKRFVLIWIVTFVIQVSLTYYFSTHLPEGEINPVKIQEIQKRYAQLILKKDVEEKPIPKSNNKIIPLEQQQNNENVDFQGKVSESIGVSGKKSGTSQRTKRQSAGGTKSYSSEESTGNEKRVTYHLPSGRNYNSPDRESFRIISQNVSDKGILGLLGSTSSQATGKAVEDILTEADKAHGKFAQTLNNVDELKRGKSSKEILAERENRLRRAVRNEEEADIGNLIAEREKVSSTAMGRKESFEKQTQSAIRQKEPELIGRRDPDDISAVVNRHNASIEACYQRELRRNPDLKGKVVVRFTISPAGNVIHVELVSSTLNNERVERCILSRIRRWDDFGAIDQSLGNTTFRQVYTFGY